EHPPVRSSARTATAAAPNSRNTGDRSSGGRISSRKPLPSSLRLYSAITVMVPLRFVRRDWTSPTSLFVASSSSLLASLICLRRARTESGGPSSQYLRTSASFALRRKTPMAPREVLDVVDGESGLAMGAKQWMGLDNDMSTMATAMDGRDRGRLDLMVMVVGWLCSLSVENFFMKDIQRQYRKLCLKHHPDKKRSDDNGGNDAAGGSKATHGNEGGLDNDFEFKEVQHAYSLIGTEEDRRSYDLRRKLFNPNSNRGSFSRHATNNNGFGQQDMNINKFGPSTIYFTFGDGVSFKFSNGHDMFRTRRGSHINNPFFGTNSHRSNVHRFGEMSEHDSRPHFIQKVVIPLQDLYAGSKNVELKLKTSIFERYKAAYNGGTLKPVLMQGAMTVMLTWLRSQKVNWLLSAFLFISMVHVHIPPAPAKAAYSTNIRQGWKGGTRISYKAADADVTFVVQECRHETFTRVGNDLHTSVEVSQRQLRKGCTLTINPLCDSEEPIKIKLRAKETKIGEIVTIKSRGWPKSGNKEEYGDLKVKISCSV
ncbi:hypothetical protein ACHAXR_010596, partial [Thalassiosira sp. AJA248-18]